MRFLATTFAATLMAFGAMFVNVEASHAQFSQAVVVMKGTVRSNETGKPVSVKVSVRAAADTAQEVTASRSNSATGTYLVVLKPGHKYWVHLEGEQIIAKDTLIETPNAQQTTQALYDFGVETLEAPAAVNIQTVINKRQD
jgi:hypothetical protein